MNKVFLVKDRSVRGVFKNKPGTLPAGEYWVSIPPNSEGKLIFTRTGEAREHWLVTHNEWRKGENRGKITSEFRS